MASTKVVVALFSGATLTAGTPSTSSGVDLQTSYGAAIGMKITNAATGPTEPAQMQVEISQDASEWYNFGDPLIGRRKGGAVVSKTVVLPDSVENARVLASGNVAANVVIDADLTHVTALS